MAAPLFEAEVGPWAAEKLDALQGYLDYYTKRLKNQRQWKTIYIDAFAGGGRARVRSKSGNPSLENLWPDENLADLDERGLISGSPRRALDLKNPFDSYIFIDADTTRVSMLQQLKAEYSSQRTISVREGSADSQISEVLRKGPTPDRHRGIAFIDPFGAHLEWDTVRALAATKVFEVIINFPLHMCLNRLMTKDPEIRAEWRRQLDAFLPPGWYSEAYEDIEGFWGAQTRKRNDATRRLLTWYRDQLRKEFGHTSVPRLIQNTRRSPLYYLLWAGPHKAGLTGADHVMKMARRTRQ